MSIELKKSDQISIQKTIDLFANIMWILSLRMDFLGPGKEGSLSFDYCPSTADGVLVLQDADGNSTKRATVLPNIYETMGESPKLRAAFLALIDAAPEVQAIVDKREADYQAALEAERIAAEETANPQPPVEEEVPV